MNASVLPQGDDLDGADLVPGELYRISYAVGSPSQRRVTRSIVIYEGASQRRLWNGEQVPCLEFSRPHGRRLSLLLSQLVDARPASVNERGQLVLTDEPTPKRRRVSRRSLLGQAAY
jgi:hypothetical protein